MLHQGLKQVLTTNINTNGFLHARDPRVLSPGDLKCRTMVVKRIPAGVLNFLFLSRGEAEHNTGLKQPCYACIGVTTTKTLECVKCGARRHKKCSSLTRNEVGQYQQLNFVCNQYNSNVGDRDKCSASGKGFRLHQYRAICNVCSTPCHLACTQLPSND